MAGMADFYLRWGDKLNQGIGQIAGAGDQLLAADQRENAAQNELAQFVDRRAAARRSERQVALQEMEAQRKREAEDKAQQRKDQDYQKVKDYNAHVLERKKLAQNGQPSFEDLVRSAGEFGVAGDPNVKTFLDFAKPEKPIQARYSIQEIGNRKVRVNLDTGEQEDLGPASTGANRSRYAVQVIDGRKVKINLDTNEQTDLGPATENEKDLSAGEVESLSALGDKRANVKHIVDGFKDSFSGVGNGIQNFIGKYTGTSEDQVLWWQGYDAFVNEIRNDLFGASLTPGEKSEFQKTIVSTGMSPAIAKKNLARQMQIVNDAVERKRAIYLAGRRVNKDQVNAAFGDASTPAGQVQEWVRDPATGKLRRK